MRKGKRPLTTQSLGVHEICNKQYGFDDCFEAMLKRNTLASRNRQKTVRVVNMYFHLKMLSVLEGNKVTLMNGMTIQIVKYIPNRPIIWTNNRNCGKPDQLYAFNPRRVGFQYKFLVTWDMMEKYDMKFQIAAKYRKMLNKILMETDKDYPIYEHQA